MSISSFGVPYLGPLAPLQLPERLRDVRRRVRRPQMRRRPASVAADTTRASPGEGLP